MFGHDGTSYLSSGTSSSGSCFHKERGSDALRPRASCESPHDGFVVAVKIERSSVGMIKQRLHFQSTEKCLINMHKYRLR